MVSSESHFECGVDYHFASEANSSVSIQVALEVVSVQPLYPESESAKKYLAVFVARRARRDRGAVLRGKSLLEFPQGCGTLRPPMRS
jgi:hypothetical protein